MVSEAIRKQLMPFVSLEYGSLGEVSMDEKLLYVEHYQAYHEVCAVELQRYLFPFKTAFRCSRPVVVQRGQHSRHKALVV